MNGKGETILITGGAGYIGSLLTGVLLQRGYRVVVVDDLLFGGESLLAYWHHPSFRFVKGDVGRPEVLQQALDANLRWPTDDSLSLSGPVSAVVHLAAIVGFPACQAVGRQVAWRYNVEATRNVFEWAEGQGVRRLVFASTYSNYGLADNGEPVDEQSPLNPQSLYAETKIAAEEYLLAKRDAVCAPVILRFATLFGLSPRTRFDLIVNQFVLEALTKRRLIIYQRGYHRSFVHVRDVVEAICLALESDEARIRGQVFNVGSKAGNYAKDEIVAMIQQEMPWVEVNYKDLSFGGDMRDIRVSFYKIEQTLGFKAQISVPEGIREIRCALEHGLVCDPTSSRHRNHDFIVQ